MKTRLVLFLLALLVITGFVSLGRWQLHRAVEKQRMLDDVGNALTHKQAQPLALAGGGAAAEYAWAAGHGRFHAAPILLLDNQRRGDRVGVHVFGIFEPDRGQALLVDLGWLPVPGNRQLPQISLPDGEQVVAGLLTPPPASGIALGPAFVAAKENRWLLTRVDLAALSQGLRIPLAPRVLRLDPALPLGYQRDLEVLPNTLPPERHRGYALQWFALALATFLLTLFLAFRRRPQ